MDKNFLTISDLSKLTGWSKSYIYKKTSDGTLKFSKPLGKTIFFNKEWVDAFLLSNTSTTNLEHDVTASTIVTLKKGGQNV
jgi:excisionase family DNA binding protein